MIYQKHITLTKGEPWTKTGCTLKDAAGAVIPLAGVTIQLVIKDKRGGTTLLTKNAVITSNTFSLTITGTETNNIVGTNGAKAFGYYRIVLTTGEVLFNEVDVIWRVM